MQTHGLVWLHAVKNKSKLSWITCDQNELIRTCMLVLVPLNEFNGLFHLQRLAAVVWWISRES